MFVQSDQLKAKTEIYKWTLNILQYWWLFHSILYIKYYIYIVILLRGLRVAVRMNTNNFYEDFRFYRNLFIRAGMWLLPRNCDPKGLPETQKLRQNTNGLKFESLNFYQYEQTLTLPKDREELRPPVLALSPSWIWNFSGSSWTQ